MANKKVFMVSIIISLMAVGLDYGYHYLTNNMAVMGYFILKFLVGVGIGYVIFSLRIPKNKRNKAITYGIVAGIAFAWLLSQAWIHQLIQSYTVYEWHFHLAHVLAYAVSAWIVLKKMKIGKNL